MTSLPPPVEDEQALLECIHHYFAWKAAALATTTTTTTTTSATSASETANDSNNNNNKYQAIAHAIEKEFPELPSLPKDTSAANLPPPDIRFFPALQAEMDLMRNRFSRVETYYLPGYYERLRAGTATLATANTTVTAAAAVLLPKSPSVETAARQLAAVRKPAPGAGTAATTPTAAAAVATATATPLTAPPVSTLVATTANGAASAENSIKRTSFPGRFLQRLPTDDWSAILMDFYKKHLETQVSFKRYCRNTEQSSRYRTFLRKWEASGLQVLLQQKIPPDDEKVKQCLDQFVVEMKRQMKETPTTTRAV